jgi:DNA-binding response OmpR family regulator
MQILLVEDDPDIRITLEQNLEDAGYVVSAAATAEDALRLALASTPDLVLLDLMLPDRPGAEVCQTLRANPATRAVPVIMVTARSSEDDRIAGFEQGADDYIGKPFSMRELMLRIEVVLKRNRAAAPAPPGPLVSAAPAAGAGLPGRIDSVWAAAREQIRVWDGFSVNHFARGEWQECQEICRTIVRRYGDQLTSAESAVLDDRIRRCEEKLVALVPSSSGGAFPQRR